MPPAGDAAGSTAAGDGTRPPSLTRRALLAVVLLIGFYALALAIAGALLLLPYAQYRYTQHINIQLLIFSLGGAGMILWSILPRLERFAAPGLELSAAAQPRLFAAVAEVAASLRQQMPTAIYLVPDVNAWVAQRGGIFGLGAQRIMGIGLPLLQAISRGELQAVLAHEFGHYSHGDTRLGPWIYRTRAALGRTLVSLESGTLLRRPFEWYATAFLRLTRRISRHQELAADAMAARTFGAGALAGGLRRTAGAALAYDAFWREELQPVLEAGYLPPMSNGFARFLAAPVVASAVARATAEAEQSAGDSNPFDSHPPLAQRLAALGTPPAAAPPDAAVTLLDDLQRLERDLLRGIGVAVDDLRAIEWDDADARVWLPHWRVTIHTGAPLLAGLTAAAIPDAAHDVDGLFARAGIGADASSDDRMNVARNVIGAAIAIVLHRRGWPSQTAPGAPVTFVNGETIVSPFQLVAHLEDGTLGADDWRALCQRHGFGDVVLAAVVDDESAVPPPAIPMNVERTRPSLSTVFGAGFLLAVLVQIGSGLLLYFPNQAVSDAARRAAGAAATRDQVIALVAGSQAGQALIAATVLLAACLALNAGHLSTRLLRGRWLVPALVTGATMIVLGSAFPSDLQLIPWARGAISGATLIGAGLGGWLGLRANAAAGAGRRVPWLVWPGEWLARRLSALGPPPGSGVMRVQIAGVSSLEEAQAAADAGADALGFTLRLPTGEHDGLTEAKARGIVAALPPFVASVLITYVDTPREAVDLCRYLGVTALQLHGPFPTPELGLIRAGLPHLKIIRAVHVTGAEAIAQARGLDRHVDALILDTYDAASGRHGATGLTHDWSISRAIVAQVRTPAILAGGLTPDNVGVAIAAVQPWGVDVHTGVEDADGSRNLAKLRAFITAAKLPGA